MKPSKITAQCLATGAALVLALTNSHASYSSAGQGMQTVLGGTVDNGALFFDSQSTWLNTANPAVGQPYNINTSFSMPSADSILNGRLILTLWGGAAGYTANLSVTINGNNLVTGGLNFGSTTDANPSFSTAQPSVYGAGSGVWLVGLPVNAGFLRTDGAANSIAITVTTPNSFDGRISQVSLLSVYQNATLNNHFQYAIAEGSGDIYGSPSSPQVNNRTVSLGGLNLANPTAATFSALYTYGDAAQNDRLFFNGTQLGGDNIARWAPSGTGLNYGPDKVSFNVLSLLGSGSNDARFSVSATDVPGTRESSLRPEIAALEITQAVPEPSAVVLVCIGLGGLVFVRRRIQE